ncbi:fas-binding factor 1 homolog isoform X3 [Esox lucius]|uniref:fas-binding factor 1 homolog isoform X3 n=1 Tax=Esox lucius TaxID=8010 RepID=UPI00097341EC|nr:fas-binding factor 1 homolog isoform X3 [Esox lucius]
MEASLQMYSKYSFSTTGSIDDMLGDLLGDDDFPVKAKASALKAGRPGAPLPSRSGQLSLFEDSDFFSKLAEDVENDNEGSDVSEADPSALLAGMKDIDDMDADLFESKKKNIPTSAQSKASSNGGPLKEPPKLGEMQKGRGILDEPSIEKKPSSAPASTARSYKKFSFNGDDDDDDVFAPTTDAKDLDDPLADLFDDLPIESTSKIPTKPNPEVSGQSAQGSPIIKKKGTASPAPVSKKRDELMFDDDEDDLMDALGFGESPKQSPKKEIVLTPKKESEPPQRARTRLDEILGRGTSPRPLERPPMVERKEPPQQENQQQPHQEKIPATKDPLVADNLTFGSYQPTLVSTAEGRQSRRQSVRFSTEDISATSPENKSKPITPVRSRPAADWLGLSQDDEEEEDEEEEPSPAPELLKITSPPSAGNKPSLSGIHVTPATTLPTETSTAKPSKPTGSSAEDSASHKEEGDWLSGALSRKKTQSSKRSEEKRTTQEDILGLGEEVNLDSFLSKRGSSPASGRKDTSSPNKDPGDSSPPREASHRPASPTAHSTPGRKEDPSRPVPRHSEMQNTSPAVQPQVALSADSLQQLLLQQQQQLQSQLLGLGGAVDIAGLQKQNRETEKQSGDLALQAQIIKLEGQVRSLQLELDQTRRLLESVQQRHKQDIELMENTHRARVKLLEDSVAQREARARQECEDLAERLATVTRISEQERMELQAQHQRRLAQTQQDRDREVERLRDLQHKSILEMKRDHEDQIQRLKRLKDEEIDAVTSATSQTRSLAVVIEQMEHVSHRLGDLSSRVESTHENTSQGLEQGARQRDEHLRGIISLLKCSIHFPFVRMIGRYAKVNFHFLLLSVMQGHLGQQQRAMAEETARLKEVIAKMETQLAEQQRQLEKERWRVTAEQAKADSSQRGLDEERRSLTQHINMEREELERAKNALLEEQQQVMQHCAEERRKLAAEWAQFHAQEKQRQERAEREASRALERDAQRESSIVSMAQEQADLKLRAGELKQREEAVVRERESLERQRQELDMEKEKLRGTALRLKTRAQEVEAFSKLASEKYEQGEEALQEARQAQTEHQARLRSIHSQMERLRQQEQHLHLERIKMTDQHREVDRLRRNLPVNTVPQSMTPIFTADVSPVLTGPEMASTMTLPQPTSPSNSPGYTELQARLALLKHTAEKDRDFLQDEQFFLDTLKKAPYNTD